MKNRIEIGIVELSEEAISGVIPSQPCHSVRDEPGLLHAPGVLSPTSLSMMKKRPQLKGNSR